MPKPAKIYFSWVLAVAAVLLFAGLSNWECKDASRYIGCFFLTLLGSMLKVRLPRIAGTFSLGFVFILLGVVDLSLGELLLMACASALVQCLWRTRQKPQTISVLFSVSNVVVNVAAAYAVFHFAREHRLSEHLIGLLVLAASVLYVMNTGMLSIVLALAEGNSVNAMWKHWVIWSFPYYLAGALLASTFNIASQYVDWSSCVLMTPLLYLVYLCYRLYVEQADNSNVRAS
jgi:hypothetical protein